jgi:hypothetical protein
MSKYKRTKTLYELTFADEEMKGLIVVMKALSVDGLLQVSKMAASIGDKDEPDLDQVAEMFGVFARHLVSWNLEDDLGDVPPDYEGVTAQELPFVLKIINAWMEKVGGGVDPTSLPGSNGGATSPEAPPPGLAEASRSLGNSPKPN